MEAKLSLAPRRHLVFFVILALGAAGIGSAMTSLALLTDRQDVPNNGFAFGTINISVTPTTAFFSVPNMMPGDSFKASVRVANIGTSQLRWRVDSYLPSGTGDLKDHIDLAIAKLSAAACSSWTGTSPLAVGHLSDVSLTGQILNAGATAVMCFRASAPLSIGNSFQGTTASTSFRFAAEQTANN